MDSDPQCPAFNISSIYTPHADAFEAAAPLVECDLNTDVSTPDNLREWRIYLLTVLAVTPHGGEVNEIKRWFMFEIS